jgi:hypothetical protein
VVPYVQVSTAQLGVAALLGLGLLGVQATVRHTSVTKRGRRSSAHVQEVAGSELAPFHTWLVGEDVVINAVTTRPPLDLSSLDQRSKQR